ncbi:MAG TPA: MmcQ/YjbR family DNA-binding protein [Acidimicrobiales bacterium]|nr:MmcQ/YjbR family DNA-binding protein [Acidimicrobiales bacterium]
MTTKKLEADLRAICLALPGVTEKLSHGAPAFFAGAQFAILWMKGHHDHTFAHLWCAAPEGAQGALIASDPRRFFYPPYVGSRGWLGVRLDGAVDRDELEELLEDAYRCVAPTRLIGKLDADR